MSYAVLFQVCILIALHVFTHCPPVNTPSHPAFGHDAGVVFPFTIIMCGTPAVDTMIGLHGDWTSSLWVLSMLILLVSTFSGLLSTFGITVSGPLSAISSSEGFTLRGLEMDDADLRTSLNICRNRGRRMAMEAAMIPVPGSAVAQMVALTACAVCTSVPFFKHAPHEGRKKRTVQRFHRAHV